MNDFMQMAQTESAAQATHPGDGNMANVVSQMLTANDNNPGFMYNDVPSILEQPAPEPPTQYAPPVQQAPPQQQYQTNPSPQYSNPAPAELMSALQYERSRNEQLHERSQYLSAIEEFLANDPVSANRAIQYLNTGALDMPTQQQHQQQSAPAHNPNDPANQYLQQQQAQIRQAQSPQVQRQQVTAVPPVLRKQLSELQEEVQYMKYKNEAADLERRYGSVFQAGPVAQYMLQNNFTSMTDAFHHLLGNSVGDLIRGQQMQQYAQQVQAWQQWQAQAQQQYQTNPSPQYTTQYPVTSTTPPPSASDQAVVMRPGPGLMASDPMDNVKPKSWNEAQALMSYDMQRLGYSV